MRGDKEFGIYGKGRWENVEGANHSLFDRLIVSSALFLDYVGLSLACLPSLNARCVEYKSDIIYLSNLKMSCTYPGVMFTEQFSNLYSLLLRYAWLCCHSGKGGPALSSSNEEYIGLQSVFDVIR